MENFVNIILSVICISIPISIIVIIAIFSIRAKQRYANEIQSNIDKGYYSHWTKKARTNRFKIIGIAQIASLLSILVLLIALVSSSSQPTKITLSCIIAIILAASISLGVVMSRFLPRK